VLDHVALIAAGGFDTDPVDRVEGQPFDQPGMALRVIGDPQCSPPGWRAMSRNALPVSIPATCVICLVLFIDPASSMNRNVQATIRIW
jgi:hypothetical protein